MEPAPEIEGCVSWRLFGIPTLFHWSFPLMGLGSGLFVGSLFYSTSFMLALQGFLWTTTSVVILVLAHELGHALAAKAFSMQVNAIVVAHIGGLCFLSAFPSARALFVVSAAGILMQLVLLLLTLVLLSIFGAPTTLPLKCVVMVFTGGNVLIMLLNLLPYGAHDGSRMVQGLRGMWAGQ
jgi:Zn-dependent protease